MSAVLFFSKNIMNVEFFVGMFIFLKKPDIMKKIRV